MLPCCAFAKRDLDSRFKDDRIGAETNRKEKTLTNKEIATVLSPRVGEAGASVV